MVTRTWIILAISAGLFATGAFIAATASNYWTTGDFVYDGVKNDGHGGLWKSCGTAMGRTVCQEVPEKLIPTWFRACRALLILAVLAAAGGVLLSFVSIRVIPMAIIACIMHAMGALFGVIGIVVYATEADRTLHTLPNDVKIEYDWGWSFITACVAAVFDGSAVLFSLVDWNSRRHEQRQSPAAVWTNASPMNPAVDDEKLPPYMKFDNSS